MNQFIDAIVIGAGQAGPSLAGRLTDAGMNVALIERKLFGGTCVNTGCMPTKAPVVSRAAVQDLPGIRDVPILTNSSLLQLDRISRHLVVVGGSYIGLEFAQVYRSFGAEVTVVERGQRLIGREDPEISDAIADILTAEGIALQLGAECIRMTPLPNGVTVGVSCASGPPEVTGSDVLLAIGRVPNTHDLGLDAAGVLTDGGGYIPVGEAGGR